MLKKRNVMTIGTLAKTAGVGVETVRYYQRRGLMSEPEKPYGGIRHYDEQALARLHFIRASQWLGFSLDEIGELLTLQDGAHCDEARELGEQKLNGDVYCPLMASLNDGFEDATTDKHKVR